MAGGSGTQVSEEISQRIATFPEYRMGVHRVTVELNDGRVFTDIDVAWERTIVRVGGSYEIPFDASDIVAVWPAN
jgi:hypothetical protein